MTRIIHGLVFVLAFAGLALGLAWIFQRRLIYLPFPAAVVPPGEMLLGAEEIDFPTEDGLRLGGWFTPALGSRAARPEAGPEHGPAVIVFNGNAGNRSHRAPLHFPVDGHQTSRSTDTRIPVDEQLISRRGSDQGHHPLA